MQLRCTPMKMKDLKPGDLFGFKIQEVTDNEEILERSSMISLYLKTNKIVNDDLGEADVTKIEVIL